MAIKAQASFSLKDHLFNADSVGVLGAALAEAAPGFDRRRFEAEVVAGFPARELKARIQHMVDVLGEHLPAAWPQSLAVLRRTLPAPLDASRSDDDFGHYIWAVPGEYVARHGCTARRLASSLAFLREATMRFSSEAAIRPFLAAFPEQTLAFVRACASDDNYHVRRLASEGIRPFLPWAQRVVLPLSDILAVLDVLHADPTRYVTRSVANTLNDVSRLDADLALATLRTWHAAGRQQPAELDWMTRHALRTLARGGHADAMALLGYAPQAQVEVSDQRCSARVAVGESYRWHCELHALAEQRLLIKLRVQFLKANGQHAPKVFAVADRAARAGERIVVDKAVAFRPITTRTLYPGSHRAELLVNGEVVAEHGFVLDAGVPRS